MATLTSDLLNPVKSAHRFDEAAMLRYAAANVEGFPPPPVDLTISQFGHGESNPTFFFEAVSRVSPGAVKRYVLRKKPPGVLLESAHAVEREFQVFHFSFFYIQIFLGCELYMCDCLGKGKDRILGSG